MRNIFVIVISMVFAAAVVSAGCSRGGGDAPRDLGGEEGDSSALVPGEEGSGGLPSGAPGEDFVADSMSLILPNGSEVDLDSKLISRYVKIKVTYTGERTVEPSLAHGGQDVELAVVSDASGELLLKPALPLQHLESYEFSIGDLSFSFTVGAPADINGDGLSDFAVGIPGYYDGSHLGAIFVFFGNADLSYGASYSSADFKIYGGNIDAQLGFAVALGDVNGDGYADVITSAPEGVLNQTKYGAAYVYYGGADVGGEISALQANAYIYRSNGHESNLGVSLAAGDVNGDGLEDIIIGEYMASGRGNDSAASNESGAVHVVFGKAGGFTAPVRFDGQQPEGTVSFDLVGRHHQHVGESVAAADLNADGIDDVIIGAPQTIGYSPEDGEVYIVPGATNIASKALSAMTPVRKPPHTSRFGLSLAAIPLTPLYGDMLFIGARGAAFTNVLGELAVKVSGSLVPSTNELVVGMAGKHIAIGDPGSSKLFIMREQWDMIDGSQPTSELGCAIAPVGDLNGDGEPDYVVGEKAFKITAAERGRVWINDTDYIVGSGSVQFGSAVAGGRLR